MKLLLSFGCCLFIGSLFSQQRIDVRKDINVSAGNMLQSVGGHDQFVALINYYNSLMR